MDFSLLKLTGINTDTDTAIERFMGNEMIYIKMLKNLLMTVHFQSSQHQLK